MGEPVNGKPFLIRSASERDAAEILRVLEKAFEIRKGSDKWKHWERLVVEEARNWRVLTVDGKVIGALHIGRCWLRVGRGRALKGDVGEVSILPRYQGEGYGTILLKDAVAWMRKQRYGISRLGGLVKFYSRFGYFRFPRRYMEISGFGGAPATGTPGGERRTSAEGVKGRIRLFDLRKDSAACEKIHGDFNRLYDWSLIPDGKNRVPVGLGTSDSLGIVFEEDGKVNGYLSACIYGKDITEFQAGVTVVDMAYRRNKPYVLSSLVKYICDFASENGATRVTARIPFDPEIIKALSAMPVNLQTIETYGGEASNMLRIVNLQSLFGRLIPELKDRLEYAGSSWQGVLEIKTENDEVQIRIDKHEIGVVSGRKADLQVPLNEFHLLELILGLVSFSEIRHIPGKNLKLNTKETALLKDLFPGRLVSSGNWG